MMAAMASRIGISSGPLTMWNCLPAEHVDLEVEHGRPDPHGRQDLHQGEPPVGDQQLQPLEEHGERPDHQGQGRQPPAALAEGEDGVLDHGLVVRPDGGDQALDLLDDRGPPGQRPTGSGLWVRVRSVTTAMPRTSPVLIA